MTEEEIKRREWENLKSLRNSRYYAVEIDEKKYVIDKQLIKVLDEKPFNKMTEEEFKIYKTKFDKILHRASLKFFNRIVKDLLEDLKDKPHALDLYGCSLREIGGNLINYSLIPYDTIHSLELVQEKVLKMINEGFENRKKEIE